MKKDILETIAMQWIKISIKELTESYNNAKIVNFDDIQDIKVLQQSKRYTFIMMERKNKNPSKIDLLIKEFREFKTDVTTRLDNIEARLDNIEARLDRHEEMLKQHGWINDNE